MITLGTLQRRRGEKHRVKRIGRGYGSGRGGHSSTRGTKGQRARKGANIHPGFEGGQMPLQRRLPKRGFTSIPRERAQIVNLDRLIDFPKGATVDAQVLKQHGIISKTQQKIKILGRGQLKHPLVIKADSFSASALQKIQEAGGKAEVL